MGVDENISAVNLSAADVQPVKRKYNKDKQPREANKEIRDLVHEAEKNGYGLSYGKYVAQKKI